jgi:hypothetical protein
MLLYLCRTHKDLQRYDDSIAAGKQAVAVFQRLIDQDPGDYSLGMSLYLAHEELSFNYQARSQWDDMIACHQAARAVLQAMATRFNGLVSRVAAIQGAIATVDHNLIMGYSSDPVRNYQALRSTYTEAYAICDKLTLIEPLSPELQRVLALASYQMADFQVEDGERPDLERYYRAERLWEELHHKALAESIYRAGLVFVRNDLAEELMIRGRSQEARGYRARSLDTVRGDPALCLEIALNYAENARLVGLYPIRLDARQQQERRRRFTGYVIPLLREAVAGGFRDASRLRLEPGLAPLRGDPDFQALLMGLDDRVFPADPFARP